MENHNGQPKKNAACSGKSLRFPLAAKTPEYNPGFRLVWLLTILRALESANDFDGLEYTDICIKVSLFIPTLQAGFRLFRKFGNFS